MQLDLRKDSKNIGKYLRQRVRDYPQYVNEGPGKDEDPVTQITVGYEFDQSGWLALVFDTRPDAEADGEWNSFIEGNSIEFDSWFQAFNDLDENGAAIRLTLPDGSKKTLGSSDSMDEMAAVLGDMIRDVLTDFQRKDGFASLPLAADYMMVVEHHDGHFGWTDREAAGQETEDEYLAKLEGNVSSKSMDNRIAHWINVLDRIALGNERESAWSFMAADHAIKRLQEIGDRAVVPMLKFVRKWSTKPEWEGDRPQKKIIELPMQTPTIGVLRSVHNSKCRSQEVELLLREIMRRSINVNASRKLWGLIPLWTARCLRQLYDYYPNPRDNERTNELINRDQFAKDRRTKQ